MNTPPPPGWNPGDDACWHRQERARWPQADGADAGYAQVYAALASDPLLAPPDGLAASTVRRLARQARIADSYRRFRRQARLALGVALVLVLALGVVFLPPRLDAMLAASTSLAWAFALMVVLPTAFGLGAWASGQRAWLFPNEKAV